MRIVTALAISGAAFLVAMLNGAGPGAAAACTAAAGLAGAGGTLAFGHTPRRTPKDRLPAAGGSLRTAVPEWQAGRRAALETTVAELTGPAHNAHAQRCAALAAMLAEQLAIPPEDTAHLTLAAALHVLPAAFPDTEDGAEDSCEFSASSLLAAASALRRIAPPEVAVLAGESCERWDGSGLPNRLLGEEASIGGRVLAAVCAFDHASAAGLEPGLEVVRTASGTAFDPVVVAELIHLFRQPWQQRQAA